MKKFIAFRILAIALIAIIGITSCSKEDETTKSVSDNAKVSTYLKSFYKTNCQLGKSVETKIMKETSALSRTAEMENVLITEVFVGDDARARGYVITDASTNEFLYFLDVDRVDYELTTVKIDVNDTKIFNDIDEFDNYAITNQLDFIEIAEDIVANPTNYETNVFIGWGPNVLSPDCVNGRRYWINYYYVCGFRTNHTRPVRDMNEEPMYAPCE